jgi:hypothetical protein
VAAPNRETNGGMRRCQRLPDVTHPVDSTRPQTLTSIRVPSRPREIPREIAGESRTEMSFVRDWRRRLTSTLNGLLDRGRFVSGHRAIFINCH